MNEREARAARATRRDHCRGCTAATLHPFFGWVTEDARENTIRPRGYYRSCSGCGLVVMVLADVTDAEGLCRSVLDDYLRPLGGAATAISKPVGPAPLDWDVALNHLLDTLWDLYAAKWNPAHGDGRVTFRSYGIGTLRRRLLSWIRDETGDASGRSKGRVYPKAHAPSVSRSYDELTERRGSLAGGGMFEGEDGIEFDRVFALEGHGDDHGRLDAFGRGRVGDVADDRSTDLARALAARSR